MSIGKVYNVAYLLKLVSVVNHFYWLINSGVKLLIISFFLHVTSIISWLNIATMPNGDTLEATVSNIWEYICFG